MDAKPSDEELVRATWQGDLTSLGILFERHHVSLYISALQLLGSRTQAEDAVQETFLIAIRKLEQVSEPGAVYGWLHRVLRNVCWMQMRTAHRELLVDDWPFDIAWSSLEASAEEQIERLALREWVWSALNRLPETLRATALLRYFSRPASYTEIAAVLGVPIGTVRSRLNQVKTKLAEALLEASGLGQSETQEIADTRKRQYSAALEEMNRGSGYDGYMATIAHDLRLVLADGQVLNRDYLMKDAEELLRVGVKVRLINMMVSGNILILESDYENPPDDPSHCPPASTQLHFQRDGLTHQLHFYVYALEREL